MNNDVHAKPSNKIKSKPSLHTIAMLVLHLPNPKLLVQNDLRELDEIAEPNLDRRHSVSRN